MSDKCPFAWGRLVHRNWRVWGLQSVEAGQSSAAEFRAAPRNYASALFVTVRHWIKSLTEVRLVSRKAFYIPCRSSYNDLKMEVGRQMF